MYLHFECLLVLNSINQLQKQIRYTTSVLNFSFEQNNEIPKIWIANTINLVYEGNELKL